MRKLIFSLGLIGLLGVCFVLGARIFSRPADLSQSEAQDDKISVVREFWNDALKKENLEKYITPPPKEFYEERSRCSLDNEMENGQTVEMTSPSQENGFTQNLRSFADEIGNGQFTILNIQNFRNWGREAVVDVVFTKNEDPNIKNRQFFFLILINDEWKIFMNTSVPNLINKEYARHDCS